MGVAIDEAGRHDLAGRIQRLARVLGNLADRDDPAVLDADVPAVARSPAAIDDGAAGDLQIEHLSLSIVQPVAAAFTA